MDSCGCGLTFEEREGERRREENEAEDSEERTVETKDKAPLTPSACSWPLLGLAASVLTLS